MKLSQAKEYLPFVQAAADGKKIQYKQYDSDWTDWDDAKHTDAFAGSDIARGVEYRIKPEPKLRAWKLPSEVPVDAIFKYAAWGVGIWARPSSNYGEGVYLEYAGVPQKTDFGRLLKDWKHSIDGGKTWLPCGVEE